MPPDLCALCGVDDGREVIAIGEPHRPYLVACALCLLVAFDTLTGYRFVKMYGQYEALKAYHARKKAEGTVGRTRPPRGERYMHADD